METQRSSCFSASFTKACEEAKHFQYLGHFDKVLKILGNEKRNSSTCQESLLIKNIEKCCNIKNKAASQKSDKFIGEYEMLLLELQGVTVTVPGCIAELCVIANILTLQLREKTSLKSEEMFKNIRSIKQVNETVLRVTSVLSNKSTAKNDRQCTWQSRDEEVLIENLIKLVKILKIKQCDVHPSLIHAVLIMTVLFTLVWNLQKQDTNQSMLVSMNYKLAKKYKASIDAYDPHMDVFILHRTDTFDLCYQATILVAFQLAINAENEEALCFIHDTMKIYDSTHHLHLLLKACIFIKKKDYESCLKLAHAVYMKIKEVDSYHNKSELSLIWNIHGICYFLQGKPNLAVRAFERSMRANHLNKASLIDMVITLKSLKQLDAEIECLQRLLSISEQENTHLPEICPLLPNFNKLFLSKLSDEFLKNFTDLKINESEDCLKLYEECLDQSWILSELAESLCIQKRFPQAADAYLDLLRILREGHQLSPLAPMKNFLQVFHKTAFALLNADRLADALTVCDYILSLRVSISVKVSSQEERPETSASANQTITLEEHVPVLLCKCECLKRVGNLSEAVSIGKRALSVLEYEHPVYDIQCKRQRLDAFAEDTRNNNPPWVLSDLKTQAYNNLAVAYIDAKDTKQALLLFRNALKCDPEKPDPDALFNFCKLLMEENLPKIALQNWNYGHESSETLQTLQELLADNYKIILR